MDSARRRAGASRPRRPGRRRTLPSWSVRHEKGTPRCPTPHPTARLPTPGPAPGAAALSPSSPASFVFARLRDSSTLARTRPRRGARLRRQPPSTRSGAAEAEAAAATWRRAGWSGRPAADGSGRIGRSPARRPARLRRGRAARRPGRGPGRGALQAQDRRHPPRRPRPLTVPPAGARPARSGGRPKARRRRARGRRGPMAPIRRWSVGPSAPRAAAGGRRSGGGGGGRDRRPVEAHRSVAPPSSTRRLLERRRGRERKGRPVGRYLMCVHVRPTPPRSPCSRAGPSSSTTCPAPGRRHPDRRQHLPRPGPERPARHGGRVRRHRHARRTPCSTGATCATTSTMSRAAAGARATPASSSC